MPRGRPRKHTLPPTSTYNGPKKGGRGRPKKIIIPFDWSDPEPVLAEISEEHAKKFERTYEDKFLISTWIYDTSISERGPIQVDIKYKKNIEEIDWEARGREISSKKYKIPKKRGRPKTYKDAKKN